MRIKHVGMHNRIEIRSSYKIRINRQVNQIINDGKDMTDKVLQIFKR